MNKAKSISTPMHLSQVLDTEEEGDKVSDKLYRGIIGSLLYLNPPYCATFTFKNNILDNSVS